MRSAVMLIGWQEFVLNRRNRWVISFALLFAVLTLLIAYFGMVTSGYSGFQDFTRTAASLVNLSGFLVPLFALLLGVFSFLTTRTALITCLKFLSPITTPLAISKHADLWP